MSWAKFGSPARQLTGLSGQDALTMAAGAPASTVHGGAIAGPAGSGALQNRGSVFRVLARPVRSAGRGEPINKSAIG